ncbi:MAG: sigma-70 family RNA polymerase sigma factor [Planctomycetales bacterium]
MNDPANSHADADEADAMFVREFVANRHRIYGYIMRILPHPADAEDVFQRTSLILWRKMSEFDPDGDFFFWACGVAFYETRNFIRVQSRDRLYFDPELIQLIADESREQDAAVDARRLALNGCIDQLPDQEREIVKQCYVGDSTIGEVAEVLGRTSNALYKQLARIRRKLSDCIEGRLQAEGAS